LEILKKIINKSNSNFKLLKVGYNLRFDDALIFVKNLLTQNKIGKIYYCKLSYANGATLTNTNKVGSLIDMGTHSINLLEYFFGNQKIKIVRKINQCNEFMNKSITDNGFIMLKIDKIICFVHHGFCTWKNMFNLEIGGSEGYLNVNSLSKWGKQKLLLGLRKYPSGLPMIKTWNFKNDNSWKNELLFIFNAIVDNDFNKFKEINSESKNTLNLIKRINKNNV